MEKLARMAKMAYFERGRDSYFGTFFEKLFPRSTIYRCIESSKFSRNLSEFAAFMFAFSILLGVKNEEFFPRIRGARGSKKSGGRRNKHPTSSTKKFLNA